MQRNSVLGLSIYVVICVAIFCYFVFASNVSTLNLVLLAVIFLAVGALIGLFGRRMTRR